MTTTLRCGPIDHWDGPRTPTGTRRRAQFGARWDTVRSDLERELDLLGATQAVIGLDLRPSDIRVDGWPKANAYAPPPVSLTTDSRHGPLRYQCDRWAHWRDNVRAIGLVLTRQRLVNDAGVGTSDQVYRGFQALPSGGAPIVVDGPMTVDQAIRVLHDAAPGVAWDWDDPVGLGLAYRAAALSTHPDHGGTADAFRQVCRARDVLAGAR